ncbi:MAG: hypothetical protein L0170_02995 [Acidobacteria bacterium]|nr:hypothetical protein [Acidobacteriota bacterium]
MDPAFQAMLASLKRLMAPWVVKAAIQKALSGLPSSHRLNRVLQDRLTGSLDLSLTRVSDQLRRAARHLQAYRKVHGRVPGTVLEVGTGWFPVIPLGLHLCGCPEIHTVDRTQLMRREDVQRTLSAVAALHREGRLSEALPEFQDDRAARLAEMARELERPGKQIDEDAALLLKRFGIHYEASSLEALALSEGSVDLALTNSVLEHLRLAEIELLLRELRRLSAASGVASHFIDLGDHYALFDRRVEVYNFLKFSDPVWSLINTRLHFQNRLRISDYRRLFEATSWRIVEEASQRGTQADLAPIRLAPRFRSYRLEDLLVYRSWVTLAPNVS